MKRSSMKCETGIMVLILSAAIVLTICLKSTRLSMRVLSDPETQTELIRAEFTGQQRTIVVTNKFILQSIAEAFKKPEIRGMRGGLAYRVKITDSLNRVIEMDVTIYHERDGFSVAIPHRFDIDDPDYRSLLFSVPVDSRISDLLEALISTTNIEKALTESVQ